MANYESISAGLDVDPAASVQFFTQQNSDEKIDGVYCEQQPLVESPTNILYMLYPNSESQKGYPYPGEYEPYSLQIVSDSAPSASSSTAGPSTAAGSGTTDAVRKRRKYTRRNKTDQTTTQSGSSSNSAGPSSRKPRLSSKSDRKRKPHSKPKSPRRAQAPVPGANILQQHTSSCKISSPLKNEVVE